MQAKIGACRSGNSLACRAGSHEAEVEISKLPLADTVKHYNSTVLRDGVPAHDGNSLLFGVQLECRSAWCFTA